MSPLPVAIPKPGKESCSLEINSYGENRGRSTCQWSQCPCLSARVVGEGKAGCWGAVPVLPPAVHTTGCETRAGLLHLNFSAWTCVSAVKPHGFTNRPCWKVVGSVLVLLPGVCHAVGAPGSVPRLLHAHHQQLFLRAHLQFPGAVLGCEFLCISH